jgi:hypothetical protein
VFTSRDNLIDRGLFPVDLGELGIRETLADDERRHAVRAVDQAHAVGPLHGHERPSRSRWDRQTVHLPPGSDLRQPTSVRSGFSHRFIGGQIFYTMRCRTGVPTPDIFRPLRARKGVQRQATERFRPSPETGFDNKTEARVFKGRPRDGIIDTAQRYRRIARRSRCPGAEPVLNHRSVEPASSSQAAILRALR